MADNPIVNPNILEEMTEEIRDFVLGKEQENRTWVLDKIQEALGGLDLSGEDFDPSELEARLDILEKVLGIDRETIRAILGGAGGGTQAGAILRTRKLTEGEDFTFTQDSVTQTNSYPDDQNRFELNQWPKPKIAQKPELKYAPGTVLTEAIVSMDFNYSMDPLDLSEATDWKLSVQERDQSGNSYPRDFNLNSVTSSIFTGVDSNTYTKITASGTASVYGGSVELVLEACLGYDFVNDEPLARPTSLAIQIATGTIDTAGIEVFCWEINEVRFVFPEGSTSAPNGVSNSGWGYLGQDQARINWFEGFNDGDVVASGNQYVNHDYQRTRPEELGLLTDLCAFGNVPDQYGIQVPMTITDTEDILAPDGVTVAAVKVTAEGTVLGATFQIEMAVGYNINDPANKPNREDVYYKVTATDLSFGSINDWFELQGFSWTMPARTVTDTFAYYGILELADPFTAPESVFVSYEIDAVDDNGRVTGEYTTPEIYPNQIRMDNVMAYTEQFPAEVDFENPALTDGSGVLMLGAVSASRGRQIALICPYDGGEVKDIRVMSVYKRTTAGLASGGESPEEPEDD